MPLGKMRKTRAIRGLALPAPASRRLGRPYGPDQQGAGASVCRRRDPWANCPGVCRRLAAIKKLSTSGKNIERGATEPVRRLVLDPRLRRHRAEQGPKKNEGAARPYCCPALPQFAALLVTPLANTLPAASTMNHIPGRGRGSVRQRSWSLARAAPSAAWLLRDGRCEVRHAPARMALLRRP